MSTESEHAEERCEHAEQLTALEEIRAVMAKRESAEIRVLTRRAAELERQLAEQSQMKTGE
jgi:hypothetical protein